MSLERSKRQPLVQENSYSHGTVGVRLSPPLPARIRQTGPGHTSSSLADFREESWPGHVALWKSFFDEDCGASLPEPSHCMLANYSFPFISSEAFITEAQTDKVVTLA